MHLIMITGNGTTMGIEGRTAGAGIGTTGIVFGPGVITIGIGLGFFGAGLGAGIVANFHASGGVPPPHPLVLN